MFLLMSRSDGEEMSVPLGRVKIAVIVSAVFGGSLATLVPMTFSLTVRVQQLEPSNSQALGFILGTAAAATLLVTPLAGTTSGQTRIWWGRRRPFAFIGGLAGLAATPALIMAESIATLAAAWIGYYASYSVASSANGSVQFNLAGQTRQSRADRPPVCRPAPDGGPGGRINQAFCGRHSGAGVPAAALIPMEVDTLAAASTNGQVS